MLIARAANPFKMEKLWTDAYNNGLSKVFFVLMYKVAKWGGKAGASISFSYLPPFSLIMPCLKA